MVSTNKFHIGDNVNYRNELEIMGFNGTVERCINNYIGQLEYLVKNSRNDEIRRVPERFLEINRKSADSKRYS